DRTGSGAAGPAMSLPHPQVPIGDKEMEYFDIEIDSDGIALVTWDMRDRSMNVLNNASCSEIREWLQRIVGDESVKGVVLTSGKESFCAGADLPELEKSFVPPADASPAEREQSVRKMIDEIVSWNRLMREIETCGKPVAAAVNGLAL